MSTKALAGLAAIDLMDIQPSPNNIRKTLTGIDELAASIRESGLIQPPVVQRILGTTKYQLVAGHRRFAAIQRLGWASCPCIVRRDMLPDEELVAMIVENGQRESLDPIEEARAFKRLQGAGINAAEIGRRIGRPGSYVNGRLMLLQLPVEEQDAVRAGHYTLGHAQGLVRAGRQAERQRINPMIRPRGRPKGAKTKPYFGDTHPLAAAARAACDHTGTPKIAGVACGACWESVIRADAIDTAAVPS